MRAKPIEPTLSANRALWGGLIFSALFTLVIALLDYRLDGIEATFPPDQGATWYFWKLTAPTWLTRLSAWGLYGLHQIAFWWLIYYAQTHVHKYSAGLHRVNLWALGMNALFMVLHLVQTQLFYDGTAQDVSVASSQYSVILMLVLILMMENQRRGLFFGKKAPISQRVTDWVRHYHGYIFAWAALYTFWFHPMVNTAGHLVGFFYMFCLMLQGSLFFTRAHVDRRWTFALEFLVLVHGTTVALVQGSGIWRMFFFGFAGIVVITQLYGFRIPQWTRVAAFIAWVIGLVVIVILDGRWTYIFPLLGIPLIEYVLVFAFSGLLWAGARVIEYFYDTGAPAASQIGTAEGGD